jgi:hypothetical protein
MAEDGFERTARDKSAKKEVFLEEGKIQNLQGAGHT